MLKIIDNTKIEKSRIRIKDLHNGDVFRFYTDSSKNWLSEDFYLIVNGGHHYINLRTYVLHSFRSGIDPMTYALKYETSLVIEKELT